MHINKISNQTIKDKLQSNTNYYGCAIYTDNEGVLEYSQFENCSFRNAICFKQLSGCEFSCCSFHMLRVGIMQSTKFYDGRVDFFELGKGRVDYLLVNTTIQKLILYQTYEIFEVQNQCILRINVVGNANVANIRGLISVLYDYLQYKSTKKVEIHTHSVSRLQEFDSLVEVCEEYAKRNREIDFVEVRCD